MADKMVVAFDFDGVIHNMDDGWKDGEIYGDINQEVIETIYELNKMKIPVYILTTRSPRQVVKFWNDQGYKLPAKEIGFDTFFYNDLDFIGVTQRKIPAQLYIDDRAYKYTGEDKSKLLMAIIKGEVE